MTINKTWTLVYILAALILIPLAFFKANGFIMEIVMETIFYLFFGGIDFAIIWFLVLFGTRIVYFIRKKPGFISRVKKFSPFVLILFGYGSIGNIFWYYLFNGRFYIVKDPSTHFVPVFPFGWWTIDEVCGGHLIGNVKMWSLQLLWLFWAIICWALTYYTFRHLTKKTAITSTTNPT